MAEFIIPSVPYINSRALDTDFRKLGVFEGSRTAGLPGETLGPLPQLLPSGSQPSMTLLAILESLLLTAYASRVPEPLRSVPEVVVTLLSPRSKVMGVPESFGKVTTAFTSYSK